EQLTIPIAQFLNFCLGYTCPRTKRAHASTPHTMFIGLCGSPASGKHTVARFLIDEYAFRYITFRDRSPGLPEDQCLQFTNVKEMEQFVTTRWRENFVTCDMDDAVALHYFRQSTWAETVNFRRKRPFFLLVAVEAPITVKYQRYLSRCLELNQPQPTLESFVLHNDLALFDMPSKFQSSFPSHSPSSPPYTKCLPIHALVSVSDLTILNPHPTLPPLYAHLRSLDLTNPERLRPSWDTYFMHLSDLVARRSNCMKRRVGCVLVKDQRVIAMGYNGTPRGMRNCNAGGSTVINVLVIAVWSRLFSLLHDLVLLAKTQEKGLGCAIKVIQAGVREVVYLRPYGMDELTRRVFAEANVLLRQHSPPSMQADPEIAEDAETNRMSE
ncbi:hypothetical protein BC937DRAFT_87617, partial [Endogone sp. FLAS-F59071]